MYLIDIIVGVIKDDQKCLLFFMIISVIFFILCKILYILIYEDQNYFIEFDFFIFF